MDKQGFIKTIEAIIAVLIIFIFIYYITPKVNNSADIENIKLIQTEVLKGISENEGFRDCITAVDNPTLLWIQGINGVTNDFPGKIANGFDPTKCLPTNEAVNIQTYIESGLPPKFQQNYRLVICEQGQCGLPPEEDEVFTTAMIITSSIKSQDYNPKVVRLYTW